MLWKACEKLMIANTQESKVKKTPGDKMDNNMLLRLAMVLQDKAPSTLDKYICKLGASILVDFNEGISID